MADHSEVVDLARHEFPRLLSFLVASLTLSLTLQLTLPPPSRKAAAAAEGHTALHEQRSEESLGLDFGE